jgi:hypothetical protein
MSTHDTAWRRQSRNRWRVAIAALRGGPAPWDEFNDRDELTRFMEAVRVAGAVAFPGGD